MSIITYMRIHNVFLNNGDVCGFDVYNNDLEFHFPNEYKTSLNGNEFFDLSCQYLEEVMEHVETTKYAKIDYYATE